MKKPNYLLWIAIAIIVPALLAIPKMTGHNGRGSTTSSVKTPPVRQSVVVNAYVAKMRPLNRSITVPGTILASEQVQLKAEAAGRIVKLALVEGARARKGDLLVKINDADLRAQLEKAQASFKLAQDREKRQKTLLDKNLISQEEHDLSVKELTAGSADIDLLTALIDKTEIRAPFDGTIGLKLVSEGAFLTIGAPVADFVKVSPCKVECSVPERYAPDMMPGAVLTFTVQGNAAKNKATVYARQPLIDEATRSLRIRALCAADAPGVTPGAFAEVTLALGENKGAIMVPTQALIPDLKQPYVFIVKAGAAAKRPVVAGVRDNENLEIVAGVDEGDTIITNGVLMVKQGMPVKIRVFESFNTDPNH